MNQTTKHVTFSGFDWASLEPEARDHVKAATERLHTLERRTGESIIEIGRTLLEVKDRIGHGYFGAWLDAEFGWSWQTANNFMNVAETFKDKFQTVGNFQARALYALASGNVPTEVREEFVARAEAGERVTHKDVKQRLAVVDLDSGEIVEPETADPEPMTEPVLPPRRQAHSLSFPVNDTARAFGNSLIQAQAPGFVMQSVSDAQGRLRGSLRVLKSYPVDVVVQHGDCSDVRERLDDMIVASSQIREIAESIRDRLRAGERLRAVK